MGTKFTLDEISRAHQGVTQETVREYLNDLSGLGVISLTTHIADGRTDYFDIEGNKLSSAAVHETYEVSNVSNQHAARKAIDSHAQGQTDYFMFSRQLAAAGVAIWVMDSVKMTLVYHSKSGEPMLTDDV